MPRSLPPAPSPLLELLLAGPHQDAVALLPPAAPAGPAPVATRNSARRRLAAPLLIVARLVLRRPQVRQLALRILKRFPALYARAYRMMMAPAAAQAPTGAPLHDDPRLSPRAAAILRALRTMPAGEAGSRRRLAFVSPLPPERTGIATYAVELLAELTAAFDITLVHAQAEVTLPPALAGLPVRPASWFAANGAEFDQILYQFGNSPFHGHMFALLAQHPGVVVLHDFYLGGALAHAQMSGALPHAWTDALLHAHGYDAVAASEDPARNAQAHKDWPVSLGVLEGATRVIVHSQYARQLAVDWYGAAAAAHIDVIPHPRTPPAVVDRAAARMALGVASDCFLVCSFGFIAPNKLTHDLLRAWTASTLHGNRDCMLVLVGANHDSPYGVEVERLIRAAGPGGQIRIAGWTDAAVYQQYLQAADAGVQLRTEAHGESSGAVLDCLNYGLPTIVNANGSMAEFPSDAVCRLPDRFATAELTAALEALWRDPAQRASLGQRAVDLLDASFRPAQCARQYVATLDRAHADVTARHAAWRAALAHVPAGDASLPGAAATLTATLQPGRRQLLVDITDWAQPGCTPDPLAGVQLRELLVHASGPLRVAPIWLDTTDGEPYYREARNATGRLLGLSWPPQPEPAIDVQHGDIYYAPNAASPAVAVAAGCGLLAAWRAQGVTVNLLVRADVPGVALPAADRVIHLVVR